ncbi:MAG: ABC transporter ATP-binding protein, partial [Planctomycetes bacterium]|nr:ABC transporter ATP-binding protein [Planctomycetota bacterium]
MITVENLTKQYAGVSAVDDISFSVDKGDILGFLGPNGAGKTTTMRMLTSFLAPTSGKITISGYDAVRQSLDTRKLIGYLPENAPSYHEMRVKEYLKFRAALKRVASADLKARLDEVLEECRIKDVANRIIGQLSKGYR